MIKVLAKQKFLIISVITFLVLRLPSLFEPYWYGDEGIYLTIGQALRKGLTLYTQIHDNKPPTLYYLAALAQTVFGFRLLLLLFMIPTIYAFYKISSHFLKQTKLAQAATFLFIIFTSIPLFEGNIANAEVFMLLPTLVGVYLALTGKNIKSFVYSGLLLGLAFTIKVPVLIEFIFLVCWLVLVQINFSLLNLRKVFLPLFIKIFTFSLAFIAPTLVLASYYNFKGALGQFMYSALLQNFGYLSSWSTGSHTGSVLQGGLFSRALVLVFFYICIYLLAYKKIIKKEIAFILFWFGATIFGALLSGRPYPHYLIQVLPPLCLILVAFFQYKKILPRISLLFALVVLVVVTAKYKFYFYPVFSYYRNYYSYMFHAQNQGKYYSFFGDSVNDTYRISSLLKDGTKSTDKIYIWGDNAYIYALADRLPPTKYIVAYHVADFNGYDLTINQIKSGLPKYIVYYPMPDRPFPALENLIRRYYFITQSFGQAIIFQLR